MTFSSCPQCNFILTPGYKNKVLIMTCRNCNFTVEGKDSLIYTKDYKLNVTESKDVVNPYVPYDNALARTNKRKCPNKECESNKNPKLREAVIRNNPIEKSLINIYRCVICNTEWTIS